MSFIRCPLSLDCIFPGLYLLLQLCLFKVRKENVVKSNYHFYLFVCVCVGLSFFLCVGISFSLK